MPNNPQIRFAKNWNGKLFNNIWSTIRMQDTDKYKIGQLYDVVLPNLHDKWLADKIYPNAECLHITHLTLDRITEPLFLLDTGLSKADGIEMLSKIYLEKVPTGCDFLQTPFSFMLFQWKNQPQDVYEQNFENHLKTA